MLCCLLASRLTAHASVACYAWAPTLAASQLTSLSGVQSVVGLREGGDALDMAGQTSEQQYQDWCRRHGDRYRQYYGKVSQSCLHCLDTSPAHALLAMPAHSLCFPASDLPCP